MIKILDTEDVAIEDILKRESTSFDEADKIAADVIANVTANGDKALFEYCERFDKVTLTSLEVTADEIEEAYAKVDADLLETMKKAAENIRAFHEKQVRNGFAITENDGIVLGQKITPIEKAGLYVPGGTASYPSTVLMNAIPAKIAGVSEIVITTPPQKDGKIAAPILAAAKIAGVDRIFKVGGAQAIAALAYGTETIPKVDKIVGPGNVFVAAAKRRVYGIVKIRQLWRLICFHRQSTTKMQAVFL